MSLSSPGSPTARVLYESNSTLVLRMGGRDASIVKEYLGLHAAHRHAAELDVLSRLQSVKGVARLAVPPRPGVLALVDSGGQSLAAMLRMQQVLPDMLLSIATQTARILVGVHAAGVIHRDINPANLIWCDGRVELIDFDVAGPLERLRTVDLDGQIVGTLAYIAPEQTGRTARPVDQRSDLYALGATLYQLATGRLPFEEADALQMVHAHLTREPMAPCDVDSRVSRAFSQIVMRLLAKAPEDRYQSAEGLLHDLARVSAHDGSPQTPFVLGERDFPAQLTGPAGLVGRQDELNQLRTVFASALHGSGRTVLVAGASGVGKTALMREMRPWVGAAGGWFVQGKVDQLQRDAAAEGAFTQALRAVARLLLAQDDESLRVQRLAIENALGRNAAFLTSTLAEFELLLGVQPPPGDIDPSTAESRFIQAALDLLSAIASPQRPLVIELDDLHWAGAMTLRMFERVMTSPALPGVMLVGTYRPVDADAQLASFLDRWRALPAPPVHLALENLPPEAASDLVARTLRLGRERAGQLARSLQSLTGGNPFDTLEMLNALRRDGVLRLMPEGWQWEDAAIARFVGRSNVVDLLAIRIARLAAPTRSVLELMSCLGNSVELPLLEVATGLNVHALREQLAAALDDGLLVVDAHSPNTIYFRHDRVQQAVLAPLDEPQRAAAHLTLARRLAGHTQFHGDAAHHFAQCVPLLQDPAEQRVAAQLLNAAADRQASTADYALAERYLIAARTVLAAHRDPSDSALRLAIDTKLHTALYSLGRHDELDALFADIEARAADPMDLLEPVCQRMRVLDLRRDAQGALGAAVALLARLGVQVPADFDDPTVPARLDALADWLRMDSAIAHASRAQIQEPRQLAVARLLSRMVRSASIDKAQQWALEWSILECLKLWTDHGACADLLVGIARISMMLMRSRGDYRTGYDITRHVLEVGEALAYEPQTSEARAVFAYVSCYWIEPFESAAGHATRAYEGVRSSGDIAYACFVRRLSTWIGFEIAPTIGASMDDIAQGLVVCQRAGNQTAEAMYRIEAQMMRALAGLTDGPLSLQDAQFDEAALIAGMGRTPFAAMTYHSRKFFLCMIFGDRHALAHHVEQLVALHGDDLVFVEAHLAVALCAAWQLQALDDGAALRADVLRTELDAQWRWFAARAADQPYNFAHLERLLAAERAWAAGQWWEAARAFDTAVAQVRKRKRAWQRALIVERAGRFHLAQGLAQTGQLLLAEALGHYEAWGATAKVAQMRAEHDFLHAGAPVAMESNSLVSVLTTTSSRGAGAMSSNTLDFVGLLQASQALSSETSLPSLAARVTGVLEALTGATHVHVLSLNDGAWRLLAPHPHAGPIELAEAHVQALLPMSAVRYAERTGEMLVVDDAVSDNRFMRDAYFADAAVCSLVVAPIVSQGQVRAMLLLENRSGRAAFNPQRLDAVHLIAGQLAVSIVNAQLYESLESRVIARTRELHEAQARLVSAARRAGKAEIANNVLHNIGNVLNSVTVSASLARRTLGNSRAASLGRVASLLDEQRDSIASFMADDPRGKALPGYLRQLMTAIEAERSEAVTDLERMSSGIEHIRYLVATQQSNAGPSSMLEVTTPHDLLGEALHVCATLIEQHGVRVERDYAQIPLLYLDKPRLLQIAVNLIGNAAQAMEDVPPASRVLTIATAISSTDEGDRLRITVSDRGVGIDADNLTRIFGHGFSSRKDGHGFGLHASAVAAVEMGGTVTAHSDGPGRGATFTIDVPLVPAPA
ncbi:trifunctional serine/threonine-protein kinase/ATP-binding protein/sensor histidine kinase [Caenimonas koreensis]|uniref:trifunctional serine/threonine-protein kinase/ATP-binding protein/sensor histidine kinase n=1 Tax=Caenimonas koreensis TaxID=367474 RepID=UPI00188FBB7D|nr:AAA family ATPase [Caenimonas koreensis]